MAFNLEILSPDKILYQGAADFVSAPSSEGEVGILPGHAPYLTILSPGRLSYRVNQENQEFQIRGGVATIEGERLVVLVDGLS